MSKKNGLSKRFLLTIATVLATSELIAASDTPERKNMPPTEKPPLLYVNDPGYFASAEFLYWQVLSGPSSQYALSKDFPVYRVGTDAPQSSLAGTMHKQDYDWNPGFRLRFGHELAYHDNWEILGQYTWYYTKGSSAVHFPSSGPTQGGFPIVTGNGFFAELFTTSPTDLGSVTSKASLRYQIADVKLQKHFGAAPFLSLALNVEVQGGWFDQDWKVVQTSLFGQTSTNRLGWKFWGVGPGLGLDSDWYCSPDWTIFMNGNICLLTGVHKASLDTRLSSSTQYSQIYSKTHPKDTRVVPHTQFDFGVSWNHLFNNNLRFLKLFAAYELNYLFNLVETYHPVTTGDNSSSGEKNYSVETDPLQLFGITIGADLGF